MWILGGYVTALKKLRKKNNNSLYFDAQYLGIRINQVPNNILRNYESINLLNQTCHFTIELRFDLLIFQTWKPHCCTFYDLCSLCKYVLEDRIVRDFQD